VGASHDQPRGARNRILGRRLAAFDGGGAMNGALAASVVICTYNRPALFEAALRSCLQDATRRAMPFEIVVADNSVAGHAAHIVARQPAGAVPVRVVAVSPPNISLARNAGLRAAAAPLVAFMDDDLQVEPGWLDALVDTLQASGADAVVGPVRPHFPEGAAPDWDPTGARFTRVLPQPSGSLIAASGPGKPADFALSTASSLWRAATCFTDAEPFDPDFGACGGEDFDLFLRLERRGCRFAWCAEAGVRETIQAGRMGVGYHRLRAYSGAQVYAAAAIKNAASPARAMLSVTARGVAQTLAFGAAALPLALASRISPSGLQQQSTRMAFAASAGWGKLTWWRRVGLYHVERPSA
jgi:succinoglycan biosynthesis protein ExoM